MKGLSVLLTLALLLLAHRLSVCLRLAGVLPAYSGRSNSHQLDWAQLQPGTKTNLRPLRVELAPRLQATRLSNGQLGGGSNWAPLTLEF